MSVKILQLSDLHIGMAQNKEARLLRRIVKCINQKYADTDILLLTGDVVDDGQKRQYQVTASILKALDPSIEVWGVPGNHDYGWNGNHAEAKRFKYFKSCFFPRENVSYPHIKEDDEKNIYIGLNSMKAETNWYDHLLADGELGTKQLRMLSGILNSLDKRPRHQKILLYLHHHPFLFPDDSMLKTAAELITHRLKDGQALMSIIKGRVDLLLFGHEHRHLNFSNSSLSSQYDIPHIHSAGKCTEIADEYQIDHQGKATQRVLKSGMLANRITINKGKITVRTIAL